MNRFRSLFFVALFVGVLALILATTTPLAGAAIGLARPGQDAPQALLAQALEKADTAGSFEVNVSLDQTVRQEHPLSFGAPEETAHFDIEGSVTKPDRARFKILPGRSSFVLAQTEPQEFLAADSKVYKRVGERWVETESNVPSIEVDGLGLSLLSVARDVEQLEPAAGPPALGEMAPAFRRVAFKLYPDDVSNYMIFQQGITDPGTAQLLRLKAPVIDGSGELWIDEAGFPARLVLHLQWVERDQNPYRILLSSTTDYGNFGQVTSQAYFDPLASARTGAPVPQSMGEQLTEIGPWLATAIGVLLLMGLLVGAGSRKRWAVTSITIVLVIALLAPTVAPAARAAGLGPQPEDGAPQRPPAEGSGLGQLVADGRELMALHTGDDAPAGALIDQEDEDGDQLPNGYELRLGTSPFSPDSDFDGLSDYTEVTGYECHYVNFLGQDAVSYYKTDPLNPDSNDDGLNDGNEVWRGDCGGGTYGHFWSDDNDGDLVPDGLDLSPFSMSGPENYGGTKDGPDLVFETLDQDPGPETKLYPFYVELQIRPTNSESLRWAFKDLFWPNDHEGAIQSNGALGGLIAQMVGEDSGADGNITLVPFLQAIVPEDDLPSLWARRNYGVSVSMLEDEDGEVVLDYNTLMPYYELTIPLNPIERGGQVYAFQAKMLHDQNNNSDFTRHWQDVRLKWAVVADVLMANSEGELVPSASGGYGLIVYDEPYYLTGMQVTRQGGASTLTMSPLPIQGEEFDDGPITLVRAGLEARFLPGALSMEQIKERFDTPSTATDEERWGIPQEQQFHVLYDPVDTSFEHLDLALATTIMTTTRQVLDEDFGSRKDLQPTLILATEQRTSTVNLDDDPPANWKDVTINTCLKPMMTSRSLKLQTYRWDVQGVEGDWESLTLDEVLEKIEAEYAANTDPDYEFYFEELHILKLSSASWYIGQTAIYKVAKSLVYRLEDIMTDPEVGFKILDAYGLLPEGFAAAVEAIMDVFEAGGPLAWLEQQWNKILGAVDTLQTGEFFLGGFIDYSPPNSPPSAGSNGLPWNNQGEGQPEKQTLLGWTETAINLLNILASIIKSGTLNVIVEMLTKTVQVYKKFVELVNSIKAAADILKSSDVAQAALGALTKELSSLAKPLSIIGLVVGVFLVWAGLMMQLSVGDFGPNVTATLVLKALAETIVMVALFVLAALFPWGTIIAVVIGLIKLLGDVFGVPLDPLSALIELIFDVEPVTVTEVSGEPDFGGLQIEALEPGGGVEVAKAFSIHAQADVFMKTTPEGEGGPGDLNESRAQLRMVELVYYPQWLVDTWYSSQGNSPWKAGDGTYRRSFNTAAGVDIDPLSPKINAEVNIYIYLRVKFRYDECGTTGCDEHTMWGNSDVVYLDPFYFDILPNHLDDFWHWDALNSPDPDGDGLEGYINSSGQATGPDANLCPGNSIPSWDDWDSDNDGLSDRFEVENEGFDPCEEDSDGDQVTDLRELYKGTKPDEADTDGDGLTDHEEDVYSNNFALVYPWYVDMEGRYPGLPNPAAYPNPLQVNLDNDYRWDYQEKEAKSSPTAMNAAPVGDPLELWVTQSCAPNQGTEITITSSPWANEDLAASDVGLELMLPVSFSGVDQYAGLRPLLPDSLSEFNDSDISFSTDESIWWSLPAIFFPGRYVRATYSGVPVLPTEPVSITARLEYNEADVTQVTSTTVPLRVNVGGPDTSLIGVLGATVIDDGTDQMSAANTTAFDQTSVAQSGSPVVIAADAGDPDWISELYVCVKTSDTCSGSDWQPAMHVSPTPFWLYDFTPPGDDVYYVRAYAVDKCGTSGPPSEAWILGVDQTLPADVSFDQADAVYMTSQAISDHPTISFSGSATDTTGAPYVSGVDWVGFLADLSPLGMTYVAEPGQVSSSFTYSWTLPESHYGKSMWGLTPAYEVLVGVSDVAGNIGTVSDTLRIVVDDTPPLVYANPPQTVQDELLSLSGLADDTALLFERGPAQPFTGTHTAADYDVAFDSGADLGSAMIAGDVNGDQIDDVVLLTSPIPDGPGGPGATPFYAGLFFGRPEGLSGVLNMGDADVILEGELPLPAAIDYPSTAAAVGDINGDGIDDLLLGDASTDTGTGKAYLLLGRHSWAAEMSLANADFVLSAAGSNGFGNAVGAAGDVNGDGLADFLIGAVGDGMSRGVVWLYLGREQGAPSAHTTFYPAGAATPEAARLAGLGDTDGDGLSDFLIAFASIPEIPAGVALVYGRPDDAWPANPVRLGDDADALFTGLSLQQTVSPAGDVNGDGLRDLLIGDPDAAESRLYILYGRRPENAWTPAPARLTLASVADASFVSDAPASRLGASMAELGDVDGDGRDDFAFGQPGSGTSPTHVAIVLSEGMLLTPDMPIQMATQLITGTVPGYYFGSSLSAGDANGDHVRDLLVGAAGEYHSYLFYGAFNPGDVSGIAQVELGLFGPVADPTLPFTATLPAEWFPAALAQPNERISTWIGEVPIEAGGDYRVYARGQDAVGNLQDIDSWYLGTLWANTMPKMIIGASITMDPPLLLEQTNLTLSGTVNSNATIQHLRVYDGYEWQRLQPALGDWSLHSVLPNQDEQDLTFRAVARDAFGATLHVSRTLLVDTRVGGALNPTGNLPLFLWHTDISPTLVITWPAVSDINGISQTWAAIDTSEQASPLTPVASNEVQRVLDAAGIYYGHVRVQDGVGNETTGHSGPYLVNRTHTPSLILPDGELSMAAGEYPDGMLLNYDPLSTEDPTTLYGTWDGEA
ncbi:MAG: hypothetical protein PVJ75_03170, partial [Chloroflexota bacterium]